MKSGSIVLAIILAGLLGWAYFLLFGSDDSNNGRRGFGGRAVTVKVQEIAEREFVDVVEALGTAKARDSVVLASRVSDTVARVNFDDGQIVKKGHVLVELIRDEEEANLREAEANLREADSQFKRIQDLVTRGNASTATLDAQQRRLDEAQSRLAASRARLADRKIIAPFDGILGLRQVSEGTLLSASTPITTIDAISQINLDFSVPERYISLLAPGQTVEAKVDAYPDRLFTGLVKTVDSRVDPATRSIIVRADVDNSDLMLRPGMLMTVNLISRKWQGLWVPEESVLPTGAYNYIFIVKDGKAERRTVQLGLRKPGYVEVVDGVEAGEKVVTEGAFRLNRTGMNVRVLGEGDLQQRPQRSGRGEGERQRRPQGANSGAGA